MATARLIGIETEYAFQGGARPEQTLDALMRRARREMPYLPDELGRGMFLENASRLYIDAGNHPELTTPECDNPWDVVRYLRAGDAILLRLAQRHLVFRSNVDYSGTRATWASHENHLHRMVDATTLPDQIIPHLVSRIVYTGAGGFRNVSRGLAFTLSPRAAHIETAVSASSTGNRGIFHVKQESLCGPGYQRLHIICGETLCSELATWLRVGATALVVALCEAGLRPGAGVALRSPVKALHDFAADPTCRAVAETTDGRRLSAIALQRTYLALAERHVGAAFMPPWAADVCRRWGAVLDALERDWRTMATTLDWAIKRTLYAERLQRRGLTWGAVAVWSSVVDRLSAALAFAHRTDVDLHAAVVLGAGSPVAAEVRRLTPLLREAGLAWEGLDPFIAARDELFEIDMRFGQLGAGGIFEALDAAGVLTHRVEGVADPTTAITTPPDVARARIRGRLVRELSGAAAHRYHSDWDAVWDEVERRFVDLSDPFVATAEWKSFDDARGVRVAGRDSTADDPVTLNQAALTNRLLHRLAEAESQLRTAILLEDTQVPADSPKRPHRRNNLAIVLLRAGRLDDATRLNADAWSLKAGRHDLTSGRILFVRTALTLLGGGDPALYLGQLRSLLARPTLECLGDIAASWEIPDVLHQLANALADDAATLLIELAEVLNDRALLPELEDLPAWRGVPPVPLETPWPEPVVHRAPRA
jgi:proteasome accessory factor A